MRNRIPSPASVPAPSLRRVADKAATMPTPAPQNVPSLRLAQVVPVDRAARLKLRDAFLQLAAAAEQGAIVGAVYSAIDCEGQTRPGALGQAQSNVALAHYAAAQLAYRLLHRNKWHFA